MACGLEEQLPVAVGAAAAMPLAAANASITTEGADFRDSATAASVVAGLEPLLRLLRGGLLGGEGVDGGSAADQAAPQAEDGEKEKQEVAEGYGSSPPRIPEVGLQAGAFSPPARQSWATLAEEEEVERLAMLELPPVPYFPCLGDGQLPVEAPFAADELAQLPILGCLQWTSLGDGVIAEVIGLWEAEMQKVKSAKKKVRKKQVRTVNKKEENTPALAAAPAQPSVVQTVKQDEQPLTGGDGRPVCRFSLEGKCWYGDRCKRSHASLVKAHVTSKGWGAPVSGGHEVAVACLRDEAREVMHQWALAIGMSYIILCEDDWLEHASALAVFFRHLVIKQKVVHALFRNAKDANLGP